MHFQQTECRSCPGRPQTPCVLCDDGRTNRSSARLTLLLQLRFCGVRLLTCAVSAEQHGCSAPDTRGVTAALALLGLHHKVNPAWYLHEKTVAFTSGIYFDRGNDCGRHSWLAGSNCNSKHAQGACAFTGKYLHSQPASNTRCKTTMGI